MGKYLKKSKTTRDSLLSVPTSPRLLTRAAKTLALKRLKSSHSPRSSYLQLRSRRLEKPPSNQPPRLNKSPSASVPLSRTCTGADSATPEASIGDEFESRHSTRETTTPCEDRDSTVPTTGEVDEFFAYAELQQQRLFIEKYNFDIVNDMPLTGRYEWVQVMP